MVDVVCTDNGATVVSSGAGADGENLLRGEKAALRRDGPLFGRRLLLLIFPDLPAERDVEDGFRFELDCDIPTGNAQDKRPDNRPMDQHSMKWEDKHHL